MQLRDRLLTQWEVPWEQVAEIWEVGPGLGCFTEPLLKRGAVKGFEIDKAFAAYLQAQYPRLEVRCIDFLEVDFASLLPERGKIAVFSNLPYRISSPFCFRLLELHSQLVSAAVVFQEEYARRIVANVGTKDYGILSILIQDSFEVKKGARLPPQAFYPVPAVESRILYFTPTSGTPYLSRVVRPAFAYRRKKLRRNLTLAFDSEKVDQAMAKLGLSENCRAEELTLNQYRDLASELL